MCAYTFTFDDKLIDSIRPRFANETAMKNWLQKEMELILIYHADTPNKQSKKEILDKIMALKHDKDGLFKLPYILPPSKYTDEELIDEYLEEKYGL